MTPTRVNVASKRPVLMVASQTGQAVGTHQGDQAQASFADALKLHVEALRADASLGATVEPAHGPNIGSTETGVPAIEDIAGELSAAYARAWGVDMPHASWTLQTSSVDLVLAHVAASCELVSDSRTPCAGGGGYPPLFYCHFQGLRGGVIEGPVAARREYDVGPGLLEGTGPSPVRVLVSCPLPNSSRLLDVGALQTGQASG